MKVYVIKEISTGRYQTPTYDFIKDLRQADLFLTYELAKNFCASDCNVVEVQIMETTDIADYTKQVRKEVCEQIKAEFDTSGFTKIDASLYPPTEEAMWIGKGFNACKERLFKKLNQIQGETDE